MMHGISMAPASSLHGGCPPIAENQEYSQPSMAPPGMVMTQRDVITPNPDYPIPANLWDLNIPHCARAPSPLSTFTRHCNTMQSPHFPTYSKQGVSEPVADISDLNRSTSSIENLRELQNSVARSFLMSQHAVVYGQKASRRRSKMNRRGCINGSKA